MTNPVKPFWASKTFWATLLMALVGGYKILAPQYHWDDKWVEGAVFVLTGLGLWGVRSADTSVTGTITPKDPQTPDNVVPSAEQPQQ